MTIKELIEYLENYEYLNSSKDYEMIMKVMEYIKTPLDKRTPEPKYYWKLKGLGKYNGCNSYFDLPPFGNGWSLGNNEDLYNTFTKTEFKNLKEKLKIELDFEPIEIEEENK